MTTDQETAFIAGFALMALGLLIMVVGYVRR